MKRIVLSVLSLCLVTNLAMASEGEYLVRLRQAPNSAAEATQTVQSKLGIVGAKVEILNAAEGLVKVSLPKAKRAQQSLDALSASPEVVSVAKNHYYTPAIHYAFRDTVRNAMEAQGLDISTLLSSQNSSILTTPVAAPAIPAVQLPSGQVSPGADPRFADDWAMHAIHLDQVQNLKGDAGFTAAIIDTGVDYNHEDLIDAMWRDPANPHVVGMDFAHNTTTPFDVVHMDFDHCGTSIGCMTGSKQEEFLSNPGHGTHCGGHIAAVAGNSKGIRGVGAGVKLMALKMFYDFNDVDATGVSVAGQGDDGAAVKAIDYAIAHGARVISASWGGYEAKADAEASELKSAIVRAQQAGVIMVIAAGNGNSLGIGQDQDSITQPDYPAAFNLDNMIVVAATDSNDALAKFSNYGATSVHIGAPGVKILSTVVGNQYNDIVGTLQIGGPVLGPILGPILGVPAVTVDWDGTSMATPIVAGGVALVWSQHPSENYHQIRDRILRTARQVPSLAGKVSSGGILDVAAAVQ